MHSSSVFCEETICSNRTCSSISVALISTRNPAFNINISFHVLFFWKLLLKCLIAKNVTVYSCLSCATLFCFVARAQTFVQQRDIKEIISLVSLSYPWIYSIFADQKLYFFVHICIINSLDFLVIETLTSHVGLLIEQVSSPSLLNLLILEYSERSK